MIQRELEYGCDTCNIELVVIDMLSIDRDQCLKPNMKKLSKHRKKGHKITNEFKDIFYDDGKSLRCNDHITKHLLMNDLVILP